MKKPEKIRRQIFLFTLEEKKVAACVLGAFLLGLATKHYRDTHPSAPPALTAKQQYAAQRATKAAAAQARSARAQREAASAARSSPTVATSQEVDGED